MEVMPFHAVPVPSRTTRLFGSWTGRGRSNAWSNRVKIAVFAPRPKASVKMAVSAKPGAFLHCRNVYCTSESKFFIGSFGYKGCQPLGEASIMPYVEPTFHFVFNHFWWQLGDRRCSIP